MQNSRKINDVCPKQGGIRYTVWVSYIESETCEGTDCAKDKLICEYNDTYHTCRKHECPLWQKAPSKL